MSIGNITSSRARLQACRKRESERRKQAAIKKDVPWAFLSLPFAQSSPVPQPPPPPSIQHSCRRLQVRVQPRVGQARRGHRDRGHLAPRAGTEEDEQASERAPTPTRARLLSLSPFFSSLRPKHRQNRNHRRSWATSCTSSSRRSAPPSQRARPLASSSRSRCEAKRARAREGKWAPDGRRRPPQRKPQPFRTAICRLASTNKRIANTHAHTRTHMHPPNPKNKKRRRPTSTALSAARWLRSTRRWATSPPRSTGSRTPAGG